jgi:hypothetical protein
MGTQGENILPVFKKNGKFASVACLSVIDPLAGTSCLSAGGVEIFRNKYFSYWDVI